MFKKTLYGFCISLTVVFVTVNYKMLIVPCVVPWYAHDNLIF